MRGNVSSPARYSIPASVVFETTKRRDGRRAPASTSSHWVFAQRTFSTAWFSSRISTGLPSTTPRRQVW